MSKQQALYQSLAACGAVLIAFIGVCHEVVGQTLFPWGPAFLGGIVIWHLIGVGCIAVGLLLLAGSLGLVKFPVVPIALVVGAAGVAISVLTALIYRQFHMFAIAVAISGASTAFFHHKAVVEQSHALQ